MLLWVFVFVARKSHEIPPKNSKPIMQALLRGGTSFQSKRGTVGWLVGNFLRLLGFRKQQLGHFDPFKENKDDGRTPANHLGCRKPGLNNGKNYLSLNWLAGCLPSTVRMLCWTKAPTQHYMFRIGDRG